DAASPGNVKVYGTDPGGSKGWRSASGEVLASAYAGGIDSTTSASFVDLPTGAPVPLVTFTLDAPANVIVHFNVQTLCTAANATLTVGIWIDSSVAIGFQQVPSVASVVTVLHGMYFTSLGAGPHTIKLQYAAASGTTTNFRSRSLVVQRSI